MEKEIILENLDESIVNEATFYSQQNIPSQIFIFVLKNLISFYMKILKN